MLKNGMLPELLAPAGSPAALAAAIEGGADAVYFGGPSFNARMRAENFTEETMRESIDLAHAYGVKAYVTLNTLPTGRELKAFLEAADMAANCGADALIVADLGGAAVIHRAFPTMPLHGSTQASGHNIAMGKELAAMGFSRMVPARELPAADIARFVRESGIETELFVHGALCVSHSGQCLFSSLVGGRSGNRGACAQPCRLPDFEGKYPLSLKDLCLAPHVPAIIEMGVDSLKIEGRLKSPSYVKAVTAVWRRLLDERRSATPDEMRYLAGIFSRGGFTDGYFTGHIDHRMCGIRREQDKKESKKEESFQGLTKKVPLTLSFTMRRDTPVTLTLFSMGKTATVTGDIPFLAEKAPMDEAAVKKNLTKLGGTPYALLRIQISMDEGLMMPLSRLNALRRAGLAALLPKREEVHPPFPSLPAPCGEKVREKTARFYHPRQITEKALRTFPICYLPLAVFAFPANGVVLPPVILDHEKEGVEQALAAAVKKGAKHALVGNLGHLEMALAAGLIPHGDFRLNVTNEVSLALLLQRGFRDVILSPELTLPQIRDMKGGGDAVIYGRIPLMLLEKCVGKEVGDCHRCDEGKNGYRDRRGEVFPILRLAPHRNELLNSRPTYMADRREDLRGAGLMGGHFIFSTETKEEVDAILKAYETEAPATFPVRRIGL